MVARPATLTPDALVVVLVRGSFEEEDEGVEDDEELDDDVALSVVGGPLCSTRKGRPTEMAGTELAVRTMALTTERRWSRSNTVNPALGSFFGRRPVVVGAIPINVVAGEGKAPVVSTPTPVAADSKASAAALVFGASAAVTATVVSEARARP